MKLPTHRLYRFYETLSPSSNLEDRITSNYVDLQEKGNPIIHLETKAGSIADEIGRFADYLLAIHQDGELRCYDKDLRRELWSSSTFAIKGQQVLLARLTDVAQAKRGLLKHREDVLASIGQTEAEQTKELLVLLTCSRPPHSLDEDLKLSLQILDISKLSVIGHGPNSQPRKAFSIDLPQNDGLKRDKCAFSLHLASGYLYQQSPDSLIVFDVGDLTPKIVYEVAVGKHDISSFLRLSSHTFALGRGSLFSLVSLPYCSIQAESTLSIPPTDEDGELRLVSHHVSLKTIIAMKGRSLIAMQLPKASTATVISRKRKRDGTLADFLGRGSYAKRSLPASNETIEPSLKNIGRLSIVSQDEVWENQKAGWAQEPPGGLKELLKAMIQEFDMQNPKATFPVDQRKVSYLLSRIFIVQRSKVMKDEEFRRRVHLKINCPNRRTVFKWLIRRGFLTKHRIEDSLRQNGALHTSESLAPAVIIDALSRADPSLQFLISVLSSQIPLNPSELVSALAIAIQRRRVSVTPEAKPKGPTANNPNNKDYSIPASTYQRLIHLLLTSFSTLAHSTVASALRLNLPRLTLFSLIDTLRLQIATAGWFTPYDNDTNTPTPTTPNNHLAQTTHLLNSTIDAIGSGGWILGSSSLLSGTIDSNNNNKKDNPHHDGNSVDEDENNLAETANTLSHMKAEVAAALEGIQEAVYLQGMLREVLLCGKDALVENQSKKKRKIEQDNVVALVDKTLGNATALPLGLKLVRTVSKTRVGAGGELKEKKRRGIEREKSRMLGVYSFERLKV